MTLSRAYDKVKVKYAGRWRDALLDPVQEPERLTKRQCRQMRKQYGLSIGQLPPGQFLNCYVIGHGNRAIQTDRIRRKK